MKPARRPPSAAPGRRHLLVATACVLLGGVGVLGANPTPAKHHHHEETLGVRSLDVFGTGDRLHIFFAEQRAGEARPQLFYQRSDDGGTSWSAAGRVDAASPPAFSPRRGSDPQIAAAGDRMIAVWTTAGTDRWGSGPMTTALSSDGGKTWKPGPNPADDGLTTGHGFIDVTADARGVFHLTWLDGRDGRQGLRYARSADAGATWSANVTVQSPTCECCANAIAAGTGGALGILFRGHDPRDMHLALSTDGGRAWTTERAGRFDWKFQGCPHVGGGLAFVGAAVHALVWTGSESRAGVFHVHGMPGAWSEPQALGDGTATHPDLVADAAGQLGAVWNGTAGADHAAVWSATRDQRARWSTPVRISATGVTATHPRVLATAAGFRVFWTEATGDAPVVWKSLPLVRE